MKRLLINSAWMMADRIYILIVSLVIGALAMRYLGPENFGLIDYAASFIAIGSAVATLGIDVTLVRYIVNKPHSTDSAVGSVLIMRLIAGLIIALLTNSFAYLLYSNNQISSLTLFAIIIQSAILILSAYETYTYYFQAQLKLKLVTLSKIIAVTVVSLWKVALLLSNASVLLFAASSSIEALLCFTVLAFIYKKNRISNIKFDYEVSKNILRESYPLILSKVMIVLYTRIDRIMLGTMIGVASVGIYASGSMLANIWHMVPLSLIASFQTTIMAAREVDYNKYEKHIKQLYAITFYLGILVFALYLLFGRLIIKLLFGDAYENVYTPLLTLSLSSILAILGSVRGVWLVCENKTFYNIFFTLSGAAIGIFMNFLLIPHLGVQGACISSIAAQSSVLIFGPLLIPSTRRSVILLFQAIILDGLSISLLFKRVKKCGHLG